MFGLIWLNFASIYKKKKSKMSKIEKPFQVQNIQHVVAQIYFKSKTYLSTLFHLPELFTGFFLTPEKLIVFLVTFKFQPFLKIKIKRQC